MRVFLDTNILIDLLLERGDFTAQALRFMEISVNKGYSICFSDLSVANTQYITRKAIPLSSFQEKIKVLLTWCTVSEVGQNALLSALNADWDDFEDSLQYFSAKNAKADVIITRNKADFKLSHIPVLTPSEFIGQHEEEVK